MADESEATPAERVDELRIDFHRNIDSMADAGEPLNVIISEEAREALEMYLKQSAGVIIEAGNGPLLGEMVINTAAEALPHLTKGAVREALTHYTREREQSEQLGTMFIGGDDEPSSD